MPYSTRGQIVARLPSVGVSVEQFDATVDEGLAWADVQIDLALANKYAVPFSPAPGSISQLAADFAAVFVLRSATESEPSQTAAENLLKHAMATLKGMVKDGVPELVESGDDAPLANGIAYHTRLGQTQSIADFCW